MTILDCWCGKSRKPLSFKGFPTYSPFCEIHHQDWLTTPNGKKAIKQQKAWNKTQPKELRSPSVWLYVPRGSDYPKTYKGRDPKYWRGSK